MNSLLTQAQDALGSHEEGGPSPSSASPTDEDQHSRRTKSVAGRFLKPRTPTVRCAEPSVPELPPAYKLAPTAQTPVAQAMIKRPVQRLWDSVRWGQLWKTAQEMAGVQGSGLGRG